MSIAMARGGVPHVFRASIDDTGRKHHFPFICNYLQVRIPGSSEPCRLYFTEDDYDNDENYVIVHLSAADTPYGEFSGPVEASDVWLKCDTTSGTSEVELVAYQRRG